MKHRRSSRTLRQSHSGRRLILGSLVVALVALIFPMSAPASALGYHFTYSMRNETTQTLTLERARIGTPAQCLIFGTTYTCTDSNNRGKDYTRSVRPQTVVPGDTVIVDSELDWLKFVQEDNIDVIYDIPGRGKVHLQSDWHDNTCKVIGTNQFTCVRLALRDWALRPAA
jgi:hypothetical protein